MLILKDFDEKYYDINTVLTVGTFDGIHLGHKKILDELIHLRNKKKLRVAVVTFEPHPQLVLKTKTEDIKLLTTVDEKLDFFNSFGIDVVYLIDFTEDFAKITAKDFIINYLVKKVGLSYLVVGYDHTFGKNREGNYSLLKDISDNYEFSISMTEEYKIDEETVKSSLIRKLINSGDIIKANKLLGYKYQIRGKVIVGDKRGKTIGFPTANIGDINSNKLIPQTGVYFVKVKIDDINYFGVMNIGNRPTISDNELIFLEVHIFDFSEDIYGKQITVYFLEKIREEKKFASIEELKHQIIKDKNYCLNKIKISNKEIWD